MKKLLILSLFMFLSTICINKDAAAQSCGGTYTGPTIKATNCTPNTPNVTACQVLAGCHWTGSACAASEVTCTSSSVVTALVCNQMPGCVWTLTATADDNAFTRTLCNALKIVTGTGGKAFAAFAIISCGIGFFTGKVSWGLMIGITCGIAAMFGAPTIVAAISGGTAADCSAR